MRRVKNMKPWFEKTNISDLEPKKSSISNHFKLFGRHGWQPAIQYLDAYVLKLDLDKIF